MMEGCSGTVMVEPSLCGSGVEVEQMVVEPDVSGKVSLVVTNPSPMAVRLSVWARPMLVKSVQVGMKVEGQWLKVLVWLCVMWVLSQ